MPHVEVNRLVRAPREVVWKVASDFESFPRFMADLQSLQVLERGDGWEVSAWEGKLSGRIVRWTERAEFDPAHYRIRYKQVKGDLKVFEGEWRFDDAGGNTDFTLTCDFEFGIPVLAALLNPVAVRAIRGNLEMMMSGIEEQVSRAREG